jgi:predicted proteasome-type protease
MGTYEDLYYEITMEVEKLGLRKEFDKKLKELRNDDKYKYSEIRDRWQIALQQVKEENENI